MTQCSNRFFLFPHITYYSQVTTIQVRRVPFHHCGFISLSDKHLKKIFFLGQMMSTVGEEKKFNPRLSKSKSEFLKIMQELQLPYPQQIGE